MDSKTIKGTMVCSSTRGGRGSSHEGTKPESAAADSTSEPTETANKRTRRGQSKRNAASRESGDTEKGTLPQKTKVSKTTKPAGKPAAKKRGRPKKGKEEKSNGESKKGPASKKVTSLDTIVEEMEETSSKGDSDVSSESSEEVATQENDQVVKGKKEAVKETSASAKDHAISEDEDEDEDSEDEPAPTKPSKSRSAKRTLPATKHSSGEPASKKTKTSDTKEDAKPKLNKTSSNYEDINFDSAAETKDGKKWNFKISSWNVAGLKAWVKKSGVDFINHEKPDIICLQEIKCNEANLPPEAKVAGYHKYWLSGEKPGYAGVALLCKEKPIKVDYGIGDKDFDTDGRLITAEFEKFFLVAVYVPNAGQKLKNLDRRMKWDPLFRAHLTKLDEKKPVILCGDMNVSHTEIDLANPKTNTKSAGFTQEERDGFSELLKEGFVDTFRHLYPKKTGAYTFWTYMGNARSRNTGWRLDYFVLSERFVPSVCDNVIRNDVYGSDHCPITLFLHI